MKQKDLEFVGTALTLTKTFKKLQSIAVVNRHSMTAGWKSTFCMERNMMTSTHAKKNRSGRISSDAMRADGFCYCCPNMGEIGVKIFRCSHCKTNLYCSKVRTVQINLSCNDCFFITCQFYIPCAMHDSLFVVGITIMQACQRKDWPVHKAECVLQSGTYDVASAYMCTEKMKQRATRCPAERVFFQSNPLPQWLHNPQTISFS